MFHAMWLGAVTICHGQDVSSAILTKSRYVRVARHAPKIAEASGACVSGLPTPRLT